MRQYNILGLLCLLLILTGCQKDNIEVYADETRVNFDVNKMQISNDTSYIQFGFVDTDTLDYDVHLILMGYAAKVDREIAIKVTGDAAFLQEGVSGMNKWIMPRNEVKTNFKIRINRCNNVIGEGQTLRIDLMDNDNFMKGIKDSVTLIISNDIPTSWVGDAKWFMNMIEDFFGPCTKAKYLFVYQTLGVWDFASWSYFGMMGEPSKFKPAVRYLKEHLQEIGPQPDPDDKSGFITFP